MGVAPTGDLFRGLTFDGFSSKDYGIYITGEGVYNAPERDVEMVAIPGRDGEFAIDNGRFANVEVVYHCGIFGDSQADFADGISEFRNVVLSRKGYVRLEDEYNPDEYRLAVYKSGLDVDASAVRAGEFDLVFDCRPQRFLTSGETILTNPDGVTNPTPFEAAPLLLLEGAGSVVFGDETVVSVQDIPIGQVQIASAQELNNTIQASSNQGFTRTDRITFPTSLLGNGTDGTTLTIGACAFIFALYNAQVPTVIQGNRTITITDESGSGTASSSDGQLQIAIPEQLFTYQFGGTVYHSVRCTLSFAEGSQSYSTDLLVRVEVSYSGNDYFNVLTYVTVLSDNAVIMGAEQITTGALTAYSTKSSLGSPLYVDFDLGEAYQIIGGVPVSSNFGVTLPPTLPRLGPGYTAVGRSGITSLQIMPRWWKI